MTKRSGSMVLALALAVGLGAVPLQAQRGTGLRGQAAGPNAGRSLDVLLENQGSFGLSEDQVAQLQQLKGTMDEEVTPLVEQMKALRERVRAGDVDADEGAREFQALRGRLTTATAPLRGRIQEILTVEQHRDLQGMVRQGRPGRGRAGAFQGRGGRGAPRGQLRGSRGGMGPRQGFNGQGRTPAFGFRQAPPNGRFYGRERGVPTARPFFRRGGGGGIPTVPPGSAGLYPQG